MNGAPANAYLVTLTPDGDGAITFQLLTGRACADGGICTADGATLTDAPAAVTIVPLQECAGPDLTGSPGEQVTLQGACGASLNGELHAAQAWTQLTGPPVTLDDATRSDPSFTIPDDATVGTTLEFQLTVTGPDGRSGVDTTIATVAYPQPTACAGPDLTGAPGEEVTLQGRCSENPYGPWYQLAHTWTQLSGPTVTLNGVNRGDPSFTLPADAEDGTTLEFQLTVIDENEQTDFDSAVVTIDSTAESSPPTACAGPDLIGAPGDTVILEGTCSTNPHGVWWRMAHVWTQPDGQHIVLSDVTRARPSFTVPANAADGTVYTFTLTVTDIDEERDSDSMTVTVSTPRTPTACAGDDMEAEPGDSVTLEGTCSVNPHGIWWRMAHLWSQPAGQQLILSDPTRGRPMFVVPTDAAAGTVYTFTLTVTDIDGESDSDDMTVTVVGQLPDANGNYAPLFDEGTFATRKLDERSPAGTEVGDPVAATDANGDSLTYTLSGDDAGAFAIDGESGQITTIAGQGYVYSQKPKYRVSVTADDGKGGVATIDVVINIRDLNDPPRFVEGESTTRSLPENSPAGTKVGDLFLATDPEVNPLTYSISGTDAGSFTIDQYTGYLKTKAGVVYDYETKSTYTLTVKATDPGGLSASIAVTVTLVDVAEAGQAPDPPTVNAVTACVTEIGSLTEATVYAGSGDDPDCRSHHKDMPARYFRFTLAEQSTVVVDLSAGSLFVSTGTPANGWGTVPGAGYLHRVSVRFANGKLLHGGLKNPTLTLAAGTYTIEAAGSGAFTLSISPQ